MADEMTAAGPRGPGEASANAVRWLTLALMAVSCAAVMFMVLITVAEVILRRLGIALPGTYDMVQMAGAVAAACALPYTTAVKGHVAIELFHQKLGPRGRMILDSVARPLSIAFFCLLAWQCARHGIDMRRTGQVSLTLQIPMFWIPWMLAASCATVVLVKVYLLFHPGRVMIKP